MDRLLEIIGSFTKNLDDEPLFILNSHFEQGISISQIARMLQKERKDVDKMLKSTLAEIKSRSLVYGFSASEVRQLLKEIENPRKYMAVLCLSRLFNQL